MLIFPLKKEWYEKIKSGEKTIEYREVKPYWQIRLWHEGCLPVSELIAYNYEEIRDIAWPVFCYMQMGYKPETRLEAVIKKVEIKNGKETDLHIDKPVYVIHFKLLNKQEACA